MRPKPRRVKKIIGKVALYAVMTFLAAVFVFPLFAMIMKSLMTNQQYWSSDFKVFPETLQWANYKTVIENSGVNGNGIPYILVYLFNTLKICALSTVGLLISASFCAYGFTKIQFKGRDLIFAVVLGSTMVPSAVMMIPLYSLYTKFGWIDTSYPMWVGMWFGGGAVNIFLVMQYMRGLPKELDESAEIDGAGYLRRYFQITLPNCKAILAVIAIGAIVGPWNDLQTPLLYLESQDNYTLALGVSYMRTDNILTMPELLAACVMMTVLPLTAFLFNQKFFVESVVMSGVKG